MADGFAPTGALATGHGRVAGLGLDGRLWVHDTTRPTAPPTRSEVTLALQGGLCVLPLAIIAVVEQAGSHVLARFEADPRGLWQVVARSRDPVLPDAVPVAVDLDGRHGGAHIAVLAGPDAKRYPHAVLGDDIEATRVLWLERHSLAPLRSLHLDGPAVFEDRLLRPWALPNGRTGLVTMQSGPLGAQLVVVAASQNETSRLEIAAAGPAIGTRNRWLSPVSVAPEDGEIWAVHTPHIGGCPAPLPGRGLRAGGRTDGDRPDQSPPGGARPGHFCARRPLAPAADAGLAPCGCLGHQDRIVSGCQPRRRTHPASGGLCQPRKRHTADRFADGDLVHLISSGVPSARARHASESVSPWVRRIRADHDHSRDKATNALFGQSAVTPTPLQTQSLPAGS